MNSNLQNAKKQKNDEFYTRLCDIENEVNKYWMSDLGGNPDVFKDKVVYLNCDSIESNFWQYFGGDFKLMKLKKIISTCIDGYKLEYDGSIPFDDFKRDWEKYKTKINGDFRSDECVNILKECDVVVTNPPFSLFREYVALLMKYEKKFLIIGNINAITYKEIFPLIKDNKLWVGYKFNGKPMCFYVPDNYEIKGTVTGDDDGRKYLGVGGTCWFTNLDIKKRHEELYLVCEYNEIDYPKYDNYDAIEVSKTVDIPKDYYGVMGVPISFLDKYNPDQFEIVGGSMDYEHTSCHIVRNYVELGYQFYKQDGTKSNSGALKDKMTPKIPFKGKSDYSVSPSGNILSAVYGRIFIKKLIRRK